MSARRDPGAPNRASDTDSSGRLGIDLHSVAVWVELSSARGTGNLERASGGAGQAFATAAGSERGGGTYEQQVAS